MTDDIVGLVELSEDCLGQNLAKFDTHLIWDQLSAVGAFSGIAVYSPKELIPQITPWVKILCS